MVGWIGMRTNNINEGASCGPNNKQPTAPLFSLFIPPTNGNSGYGLEVEASHDFSGLLRHAKLEDRVAVKQRAGIRPEKNRLHPPVLNHGNGKCTIY